MITSDIQNAYAGQLIELFELDLTTIGINEHYYFHNGVNELGNDVVFNGLTYARLPLEAEGFERTGTGQQARPTLRMANIEGLLGALVRANKDLIKARLIRRRTFLKYIDAINFEGGFNPTADPNAALDDEAYFIDRKATENKLLIEFELVSALDLEGQFLPKRMCVRSNCVWKYRSAECSYAGPPVATKADEPTSDPLLDDCGKRLDSCRLRFGNGDLPIGVFPAISLIR
jgi:lambda family phage minor tail protein L